MFLMCYCSTRTQMFHYKMVVAIKNKEIPFTFSSYDILKMRLKGKESYLKQKSTTNKI